MKRTSRNTQMFALRNGPPATVAVAGAEYRLVRVFKHDFWAATCLYRPVRGVGDAEPGRAGRPGAGGSGQAGGPGRAGDIVVKFGRAQPWCGLPLGFYARWLATHERAIYRRLAGIEGVPRCLGLVGDRAVAIAYADAQGLDHLAELGEIPLGLFDRLRALFDAVHARGVAYCDANKRSNILVTRQGRPVLIDFQIAIAERDDLPWPIRAVLRAAVRYMTGKDLYHLYKHKRRLAPARLTPAEDRLSRHRSGLHLLHRKLTKPYRRLRRWFLARQHAKGALTSPSAEIEDHYQPEKATWRRAASDKAASDHAASDHAAGDQAASDHLPGQEG